MQSFVARGKIASRGGRESYLAIDLNPCPVAVTVATHPAKRNRQPVRFAAAIQIELPPLPGRSGNCVDPPVIIKVAESRAAAGYGQSRPDVPFLETTSIVHSQQRN